MDACFINAIANEYPDNPNYQIVQNYREFFEALQYVIPSESFRYKYRNYLKHYPIEFHLENRQTLTEWCRNVYQFEESCIYDPFIILQYAMAIAQHYPIKPNFQEVLLYKNFFLSLGNLYSKFHKRYLAYLRINPVDQSLSSREALQSWVNEFLRGVQSTDLTPALEHFSTPFNYAMVVVPCLLIVAAVLVKNGL